MRTTSILLTTLLAACGTSTDLEVLPGAGDRDVESQLAWLYQRSGLPIEVVGEVDNGLAALAPALRAGQAALAADQVAPTPTNKMGVARNLWAANRPGSGKRCRPEGPDQSPATK